MSAARSHPKTGRESENTSSTRDQILNSFKIGKEYRHAFVEEKVRSHVAAQIRAIRENRGLTQPDLAAMMGKSQSWVSRLEDANEAPPTIMSLLQVAEAFDVDLEIMFAPFSSLLNRLASLTPESLPVQSFEEDDGFSASVSDQREISYSDPITVTGNGETGDSISFNVVNIEGWKIRQKDIELTDKSPYHTACVALER